MSETDPKLVENPVTRIIERMFDGEEGDGLDVRSEVAASLERSVSENRALWERLAEPEILVRLRRTIDASARRATSLLSGGDPVQGIVDLLGNLPGDDSTWREIIEEPYG